MILLFLFVAIQFYQPALNVNKDEVDTTGFMQMYQVPAEVKTILKTSCYDCHSNHTSYAWYDYIQPVRILVESHIKKAKEDLNFNEWGTYSDRKKERLLNSIKKQVETRKMPLPSYTFMHQKAKLDDSEIKTLISWLEGQE